METGVSAARNGIRSNPLFGGALAMAAALALGLLLAGTGTAETAGSFTDNCAGGCWVKASSGPLLVFSLTLHNNSVGGDWESTVNWANFTFTSVSGFNGSVDLAALTDTASSGVAVYNESGATAGFQPGEDVVVGNTGSATWFEPVAGTYRLNISFSGEGFRLRAAPSGTSAYLVIRTSGGVGDGNQWTAGLAANQLNATYGNLTSGGTSGTITADITAPTSSVDAINPYWRTSPTTITATASDGGSGVAKVDLWYRNSTNNVTWSAWTFFGGDTSAPYEFSFGFPAGQGYYEFYSIANDTAGNSEAAPGSADARAAYDTSAPFSTVQTIPGGYWKTTSPLAIPWNATDNLRLANVTLQYQFRPDNSSGFGAWTFFAANTTVNGTSASGNFTFTYPAGQGHYQLRTIAKDAAGNNETGGAADEAVGFDSVAPASSVNAISPYWRTAANVTVNVTATDATSGVAKVDLYYRSSTDNVTFGSWTFFQGDTAAPYAFNFTFPDGQRFYEFHSRANDTAGNSEGFTAVDALCAFDSTAPASSVSAISGYWKTSPLLVPWSATDNLRLANVTLEFRYRANNGSAPGSWTFFAANTTVTGTSASGNFSFTFPSGQGIYEFRTIAKDAAANTETAGAADEEVGFDTVAPSSTVDGISPYWRTANTTITATASDAVSGVANVALQYQFSADNGTFGAWTPFGSDSTAPYTFLFDWPDGQGYYRFRSLATDNASNAEGAPPGFDTQAAYDVTAPASTVGAIGGYWKNTSPLAVPWSATDNLRLANVTLEYRYRADNSTPFGNWTFFASNTTVSGTSASGNFSFTFPNGDGHYEFRTVARDAAGNAETPGVADETVGYDATKPISLANAIDPYWRNANTTINATASDNLSNVTNVDLWYRYRADNSTSFGNWTFFGMDTTSPYSFLFTWPAGQGFYEFYTIANDTAGNSELPPGTADTAAGFDTTPPTSSANAITPYWHTADVVITAAASDDRSGVQRVNLFYRRSTDNVTWSNWTFFETDSAAPYTWTFTWPAGQGFYEFYTYARDNATNAESPPIPADTRAAYDVTPPSSTVTAIGPYWFTGSSMSVPWTATDNLRLSNVTLQYRFKTDNSSAFGNWTFYAANTTVSGTSASGSFTFSFPGGEGIFEFRTVARDAAGNAETPGAADEEVGHDTTPPSSTVDPINPYWGNSSPRTLPVTASDNLSGVLSVSLYYRHASVNGTYGSWTLYGTDSSAPFTFDFSFPDGEGWYRFHSIATDRAGLIEAPPAGFDAEAGYDTTLPVSSVDPNNPYWRNATVTIPVTASDDRSGVAAVELWYRYAPDNFSWDPWTLFGTDTTSPFEFVFTWPSFEGYYEFYSIARDRATNEELPPGSADTIAGYDITPPGSFAFALSPYWYTASPLPVSWIAFDNLELTNVSLQYRFRAHNGTGFGPWTFFAADTTVSGTFATGTFTFPFPNGQGHYEFRTIAKDGPGNTEAPPGAADAIAGYDFTVPSSTVTLISPHWRNASPLAVNWTASDNVALGNVTLEYRYRASTFETWGAWTFFASNTSVSGIAASGTFSFPFPGGEGYYELRTRARDQAGNAEAAGGMDEDAGYDVTAATSYANALDPYQTTPSFTVTATATDALSGVAQVELLYRKDSGSWSLYGTDGTAPYSWTFDTGSTGGDGLYEFRTISRDVAGNLESTPAGADASTRVDTQAPTTTATLSGTSGSNGWWRSAVSVTLTATDPAPSSGGLVIRYRVDGGSWTVYSGIFSVIGDGTHTVHFYTSDAAGNAEALRSQEIRIDATNPSGSANAQPASRNARTFSVTWTGSDATSGLDLVRFYYSTDGGANWTEYGSGFTASPIEFTAPSDGPFNFSVRAFDRAGNSEATPASAADIEASTFVDTVAPTTTLALSGTAGSNGWWRSSVTVTITAIDPSPSYGAETIRYRVDGGSWTVYSAPFVLSTDGAHTVDAYSTDDAGNTGPTASSDADIDATAPSATAGAQPATRNVRDFDVTWTGGDATSGLDLVRLYYSTNGGATWTEYGSGFTASPITFVAASDGTFRFNVRAFDLAGNSEAAPASGADTEALTVVDTVAPSTSHTLSGTLGSNAWFTTAVTVTLTPSDPAPSSGSLVTRYRLDSGDWTTYAGAFAVSTDGDHTALYYATDAAGNVEPTRSATFRIDGTAPDATAVALPSYTGSRSFAVTWAGSDAASGLSNVALFFSVSGGASWTFYGGGYTSSPIPFIISSDGPVAFSVLAVDLAGNSEPVPSGAGSVEASTLVDTAAPSSSHSLAGTAGTNGWFSSAVTVTFASSDPAPASGVSVTRYRVDDGGWFTYVAPFAVALDGTHDLFYYSVDTGGNAEVVRSFSLRIDATLPTSFASPLPAVLADRTVAVYFTAADGTSGVAAIDLWVNQGAGFAFYGTFTASPAPFLAPQDGPFYFYTRAVDVAGNVEAAAGVEDADTFIDTEAPATLASLSGTAGSGDWYRSVVTVTLLTADPSPASGVAYSWYRLDGGSVTVYSGPFIVNSAGRHTVSYGSVDDADNAEAASTRSFGIDDTAPTSNAFALPAATAIRLLTIPFIASDDTSGVAAIELWVDFGAGFAFSGTFTTSPASYVAVTDGTFRFYTRALDVAGSYEAAPGAEDASTTVDTSSPMTTDDAPGGWSTTSPVTVTLSPFDGGSGVCATTFRVDGGPWTSGTAGLVAGDGVHTIAYYSVDCAGNLEATNTATVRLDATKPASSVSPLPFYLNSRLLTLGLTATDATSGVASLDLWVNRGAGWFLAGPVANPATYAAVNDGPILLYTVATDAAGNVEDAPLSEDASSTIDTVPPSTSTTAGGWYLVDPVTVDLTATDASSGVCATSYRVDAGSWTLGTTASVSGDGMHTVSFYSEDCAGNAELAGSVAVGIDTTPPSATLAALPAFRTSRTFDLAWTAVEATSGIDHVRLFFSVNGGATWNQYPGAFTASPIPFLATADGIHLFAAVAYDVAGGNEAPSPPDAAEASTVVDTLAPATAHTLSGVSGNGGWYVSGVSLTLTATDPSPASGIAGTFYRIDPGNWATYTGAVAIGGDGAHTISYYSADAAGNRGAEVTATVRIDATAPDAAALPLAPFQDARLFEVPFSVREDGSGLVLVRLRYTRDGGTTWTEFGGGFTSSPVLFVAPGDGNYGFSMQGFDAAGNAETVTTGVAAIESTTQVDTLAPATTDDAVFGWIRAASVTVTFTATDAGVGVCATRYSVDGGAWSVGAAVSIATPGVHRLEYASADCAGNAEAAHVRTVSLDNTAPTSLALSSPRVVGGAILVSFAATDGGSGIAGVELWYSADGISFVRYETAVYTASPIFFHPAAEGTYSFYTIALDVAGNRESKIVADAVTVYVEDEPVPAPTDSGLLGWIVLLALLTLVSLLLGLMAFFSLHRGLRELAAVGTKRDQGEDAEEIQAELLE